MDNSVKGVKGTFMTRIDIANGRVTRLKSCICHTILLFFSLPAISIVIFLFVTTLPEPEPAQCCHMATSIFSECFPYSSPEVNSIRIGWRVNSFRVKIECCHMATLGRFGIIWTAYCSYPNSHCIYFMHPVSSSIFFIPLRFLFFSQSISLFLSLKSSMQMDQQLIKPLVMSSMELI